MRDQIAAMFRGPWRLEINRAEGSVHDLGLMHIIYVQAAWRALTKAARRALVDLAEKDPGDEDPIHPLTWRALVLHGLIEQSGAVTEAGRAVVRHRPRPPVVDVHLPESPSGGVDPLAVT